MSQIFLQIYRLVQKGEVLVSEHGYTELAEDGITVREIINSLEGGVTVEEYPDYPKGPCVLVLQKGEDGQAIHVVWGIPKGLSTPAVIVTAYRPDPELWSDDFLRRKR